MVDAAARHGRQQAGPHPDQSATRKSSIRYRPEIDGLRAVAILPVLLYHAGVAQLSGGYVGVDVFFVISGYLITSLIEHDLAKSRFSITRFYSRRVRRILPALFACTSLSALAAILLFTPPFLIDFSKSLISTSFFGSNIYFWKFSGYFDNSAALRPLLHTWSLAVEEQFYVFMPIALVVLARVAKFRIVILALAASLSLALSVYMTTHGPTANFFLLPTRAWELLLGALLAYLPRPKPTWIGDALTLVGLVFIGFAIFSYDEATPFPGLSALAPCLGAALVIGWAHSANAFTGKLLTWTPLVSIGLVSYSLYLVHWPIVVFWKYWTLLAPDALSTALIIGLSMLIAYASFFLIERPARTAPISDGWMIGSGIAALALTAALGFAGWSNGAVEQQTQAQAAAPAMRGQSWRNGVCFFEGQANFETWNADDCLLHAGGAVPTLLWGDSFAAHYAPGLSGLPSDNEFKIYQFTAAGCPPILTYQSYARPWCRDFNARALQIIDTLGVKRVILSARWIDMRARGLEELRSTLSALQDRHIDVIVIGQSPMFIADVHLIGARTNANAWPISIDPAINRQLASLAAEVTFVDPIALDCDDRRCPFRDRTSYLFSDYGHLSDHGSEAAVRRYRGLTAPLHSSQPAPGPNRTAEH